ncbi:Lar family restriction alleviation protein [Leptolyngbya subtilissima]|uniref:Lar family restriction alleviation protein n=1 Tax=Leptolyngbya subtilissima TaxID=1346803 RepID=UPI003D6555DB
MPCPSCGSLNIGCGLENSASYCVACQDCGYLGKQIGVNEGEEETPPLLMAIKFWNRYRST